MDRGRDLLPRDVMCVSGVGGGEKEESKMTPRIWGSTTRWSVVTLAEMGRVGRMHSVSSLVVVVAMWQWI